MTEEAAARPERKGLPFIVEFPLLVLVALAVAIVIKTFLVQAFWIPSSSMVPTLEVDDRVLVNKLEYRLGQPEPGDVVVFESPYGDDEVDEPFIEAFARSIVESLGIRTATVPDDFIKRVIATEGQEVAIVGNQVVVDGVALDEPYLPAGVDMADMEPTTIGPDELWVMGDNRNHSSDSRVFGPIPADEVVGRAFVVMWPLDRWSGL
ncbi:MAG: signal peptidase I [Acidimicrobiia bacterium]